MFQIQKAKNGSTTLKISTFQIHSSYSPEKEVERFLKTFHLQSKNLILLCGETLGYMTSFIQKHFPNIQIILIFFHQDFTSLFSIPEGIPFWTPSGEEHLSSFLQKNIPILNTIGIEVIQWPACAKAFPSVSNEIQQTLNQFFLEAAGSINTIKNFGNVWLKNTLTNYLSLKNVHFFNVSNNNPIVITASGPTLEYNLNILKTIRDKINLWALPSSLDALLSNNIIPDLIIETDSGFYATHHLRSLQKEPIPVAMPLTGCRGLWGCDSPILLFSQGTVIEKTIYNNMCITPPIIPPAGTVAISALFLALKYSKNNQIFLAGYDFEHKDIKTHIIPNSFMNIFYSESQKINPVINTLFMRSFTGGSGQPPSLKTYSGWLSRFTGNLQKRVFRLHPTKVNLGEISGVDDTSFLKTCTQYSDKPEKTFDKNKIFTKNISHNKIVGKILDQWQASFEELQNSPVSAINDFFLNDKPIDIMLLLSPYSVLNTKKYFNTQETSQQEKLVIELLKIMHLQINVLREKYLR